MRNRHVPLRVLALVATFAVSIAPAQVQELRQLDTTIPTGAAYDSARGRLVTLGWRGDTSEFDGQVWRHRPVPAIGHQWGALVNGAGTSDVLLVGQSSSKRFLTGRYDGVRWQFLQPAMSPSSRQLFAIALDSSRNEVVLFGGTDGTLMFDETWVFTGSTWRQRLPASSPPPRTAAGMVFDVARGCCVMFGGGNVGLLQDTWEWDGANWTQPLLANQPSARSLMAMAYDPLRARTVLFGGVGHPYLELGDLWEYDGSTWQLRLPPMPVVGPVASTAPKAVFDPARGEVVLVGGYAGAQLLGDVFSWNGARWLPLPSAPLLPVHSERSAVMAEPQGTSLILFSGGSYLLHGETWRWNGRDWSQASTTGPVPRFGAAFCTGSAQCYLFGGEAGAWGPTLGDLWQWDGTIWTQLPSGPPPRMGAAMAFDSLHNEVVLFGGGSSTWLGDTWTWNGTSWQQHTPSTSPAPRTYPGMAFDGAGMRVLLCGGYAWPMLSPDTWQWDGTNWSVVPVTATPAYASGASMAFDEQRQQVVLAMPSDGLPTHLWTFDGTRWSQLATSRTLPTYWRSVAIGSPWPNGVVFADGASLFGLDAASPQSVSYGNACGANAPELGANRWPQLGAADFGIDVVHAPPSAAVALLGALQSASIHVAGCTLLLQPGPATLLVQASATGSATSSLPLPNAPGLLGVDLYFQAAALVPTSPSGFVMSPGLQVTIGR